MRTTVRMGAPGDPRGHPLMTWDVCWQFISFSLEGSSLGSLCGFHYSICKYHLHAEPILPKEFILLLSRKHFVAIISFDCILNNE